MNNRMCPVCMGEFKGFLNLARHMILKALNEGEGGEHEVWLTGFLGVSLQTYSHRNDKNVALRLYKYWKKHKSWPSIEWPSEKYEL